MSSGSSTRTSGAPLPATAAWSSSKGRRDRQEPAAGRGATAADGSLLVLSARGGELEGEFPFGVVRQLFETRCRRRAGAAHGGPRHPPPPSSGSSDGWAKARRSRPCTACTGSCSTSPSEGPLLLAVDDLHWCDRPSLLFFAYLARRLEGQPILLAGRPARGRARHRPRAARRDRARSGRRPRAPGAAERGGGGEVIEERLGAQPAPAFAAACHEATGGNPLLLSQLVTALAGEGVRPDARARRPRAGDRPAGGLAHGAAAAHAPAAGGRSGRAGDRGAGRRRRPPRSWPRSPRSMWRRSARPPASSARAEILRARAAARLRRTRSCATPSTTSCPRSERELQHARAADLLRSSGAPPSTSPRSCSHTPPRGERLGGGAAVEAAGRARDAGGSGGQRRRLPAARARTSSPFRAAAAAVRARGRPRC